MPSNECIYWFTWLHRKKKCVVRAPNYIMNIYIYIFFKDFIFKKYIFTD